MPVLDLLDLPAALPPRTPVVGLDLGREDHRRGGLRHHPAASPVPLELIRQNKFTEDAQALFKLMASAAPVAWSIGLPVNMDGTRGPALPVGRAFARNLLRLRPTCPSPSGTSGCRPRPSSGC